MTMIFVPKIKELILPVRMRTRFRGRFIIETQAEGQPRRKRAEFPNLITNGGLDQLCSSTGFLGVCAVGSGNATPLVTNTQLQTLVGSTSSLFSSTGGVQSTPPYYGTITNTYNFGAGTATGNLAEVGVGGSVTNLMSRALIVTSGGSPTTITVLSSEALYVTYVLEQYAPATDVTGNITIAGVSYAYTLRAESANTGAWGITNSQPLIHSCTAYNGSIGTITGIPSGTAASSDSISTASYSAGSYTLDYTAGFSIAAGNLSGGISALDFSLGNPAPTRGAFQIGLGASIPKTGSNVLTLQFSSTWSA